MKRPSLDDNPEMLAELRAIGRKEYLKIRAAQAKAKAEREEKEKAAALVSKAVACN